MHSDERVHEASGRNAVFVIGASRGIGAALYDHYKNEGRWVRGTHFRNKTREDSWGLDATDREECDTLVPVSFQKSTVICCAGRNLDSFAHKTSPEDYWQVCRDSLLAPFVVSSSFLVPMRKLGYGRIIFLGSVVPSLGVMGTAAYSSAKAGLWGLTKVLAAENASKGITVNCLDLGYFDMGMGSRLTNDQKAGAIAKIPQGKFGAIDSIVAAVEFLERCDYITGESIRIAGGL